jgi:hypothetical protein
MVVGPQKVVGELLAWRVSTVFHSLAAEAAASRGVVQL